MQSTSPVLVLPLEVVEPLCSPFSRQADWILKLYEMTQGRSAHPGKCVSCFFALLGAAKGEKRRALEPLRTWIEENLEIGIWAGDREAGKLPVLLEASDLEELCSEAMNRIQEDAVIAADQVELQFRFKTSRAA